MVLAVVLLVQQIESHILQPFILGRLVRVHPLAVVLGVTGGSLIAGIPGAVVAVPLVAVINTVFGYLRGYQQEADRRASRPHGAAAAAPAADPPPVPSAPRRPPRRRGRTGRPRSSATARGRGRGESTDVLHARPRPGGRCGPLSSRRGPASRAGSVRRLAAPCGLRRSVSVLQPSGGATAAQPSTAPVP